MGLRIVFLFTGMTGAALIALGAMTAHGSFDDLGEQALAWLKTAQQYGMWHVLLLAAICLGGQARGLNRLAWASLGCLMTGIVLFSGSLILMALTDITSLGMLTPLGGLALIVSWLLLGLAGAAGLKPRN